MPPVGALQQPEWLDPARAQVVTDKLSRLPGPVNWTEVLLLRSFLARAATGSYQVIQAGDCAEDPADCTCFAVTRKFALLDTIAEVMETRTGKPVIRIGRVGGQFAKPRSAPTELVNGVRLPVYRGHLINGPEADPVVRQPDPDRMLTCYEAACRVTETLRLRAQGWLPPSGVPLWASHEALVLDYELPFIRRTPTGQKVLTSTHLPWVGERTRQVDGAHVTMLAQVINPVGCKIGPAATQAEVRQLCERLDPHREPGRLVLIARMGADRVATAFPPLVSALRSEGHSITWLCDPMHGNTIRTRGELKTRLMRDVIAEVVAFQEAVADEGDVAAGLHLEATPEWVTECAWSVADLGHVGERYTSLCDPRLNPAQSLRVADAWRAPMTGRRSDS
jgi:3-deoxy-7-phosphoheptulonate synthase